MSIEGPDADSPAEQRLRQLLAPLRTDAPGPPAELEPRVLRTLRWQRAVRETLDAVGNLAGVVGDGVRLLVGSGRRHR